MKIFMYEGVAYKDEPQVRRAIWVKARKALPVLRTSDEWGKFGVQIIEEEARHLTQSELARNIKKQRDTLLEESDFFVLPDYPASESDLNAVKAYRQELRDITMQPGFPKNVIFPELPDALRTKKSA